MSKIGEVVRVCALAPAVLRRSCARLAALMTLGFALLVPSGALSEPASGSGDVTVIDCSDEITATVCSNCHDYASCQLCLDASIACCEKTPSACIEGCESCTEACGIGDCCGDGEVC